MRTIITKKNDDHLLVGGKPVIRDMNGNWLQQLPLTEHEKRDMYSFLEEHNIH